MLVDNYELKNITIALSNIVTAYVTTSGMNAENQACEAEEIPPKYREDDYFKALLKSGADYNSVVSLINR